LKVHKIDISNTDKTVSRIVIVIVIHTLRTKSTVINRFAALQEANAYRSAATCCAVHICLRELHAHEWHRSEKSECP